MSHESAAASPAVPAIAFCDVSFSYEASSPVLEGLSFTVRAGEAVALVGSNGSGKSTVAKLTDAMLLPDSGCVRIFGMDTRERACLFKVRASCGMVFQNPDDQLVSTLVRDEVAFGPRNLGLSREEVSDRVTEALQAVGMEEAQGADVNSLSGGQKQRVAIAGALAMHPRILILDEATSMLDVAGASEVVEVLEGLKRSGMTLLLITHGTELEGLADRVIRLGSESEGATSCHVRSVGSSDLVEGEARGAMPGEGHADPAIEFDDVVFAYEEGEPPVLNRLSFAIQPGEFVSITGVNGSGKSTLLKLMNGLLQSQSGEVRIFGRSLDTKAARNGARRSVGLAFQHSESQLFESTVYDDVAFGPRNQGLAEEEVQGRVRLALGQVGLPFDEFYRRNPFALSGGQQRKAALAGILALQTPVLALDEPCAGLDGRSRCELLNLLVRLHEQSVTIVMVSHSPADVAALGCRQLHL